MHFLLDSDSVMTLFKYKVALVLTICGIIFYLFIHLRTKIVFNNYDNLSKFHGYFRLEEYNSSVTTISISKAETKLLKKKLEIALKKARNQTYRILIWEPQFGERPQRVLDVNNCGSCEISYKKELVDDPVTKAIVFHYFEFRLDHIPKTRSSQQYYVWWSQEPPPILRYHRKQLDGLDNFFNLTMTYRRDSDILSFYGHARNALQRIHHNVKYNVQTDIDELIMHKQELAAWIVSNCGNTAGARLRLKYAEELVNAGLRLDRRGKCFPENGKIEISDITRYKFYLAFENSFHCKDYITEKLFRNAFEMGTVPVVLGPRKLDYEALVPPGSCIYAEDYKSPKDLVDFLNYLDNNQSAYREYFKWRSMNVSDMPMNGIATDFCQLCRVLHGINIDNIYNRKFSELQSYIPLFGYPNRTRVVSSLKYWVYYQEEETCLNNQVNFVDFLNKTSEEKYQVEKQS